MIRPSPLTTRRNGNSNKDCRNRSVTQFLRDTFVPGTNCARERLMFRMRIQNECTKRVSFEFMSRSKAPLPMSETLRTLIKCLTIHTPQLDSRRPQSLAESRLENEAPGSFNHQTIEAFCAPVGLRPIGCTRIMGQRPRCSYSSCSCCKFRSCIRPPTHDYWSIIIKSMHRVHD